MVYRIYVESFFRSTGELTSNYLKGKEARISSFLSDNEFEQIDFVRSLIQHMNHYQLGTIDNDLQVQLEPTIFQQKFSTFFFSHYCNAILSVSWRSAECQN